MFKTAFENENFIAVDKPPLVLTTPARQTSDPRPCLGRDLQAALGIQIYPIHRLDFEVSGLVLFAKTSLAHRLAQKWFEKALVEKTYRALSEPASLGASSSASSLDWVEWTSKLVRGKKRTFEADHGKASQTHARLVMTESSVHWLWELRPVTGRPHQLRFEMFKHGHPILRDVLYGARPSAAGERKGIALRSVSLDFRRIEDRERLGLPETISVPADDLE